MKDRTGYRWCLACARFQPRSYTLFLGWSPPHIPAMIQPANEHVHGIGQSSDQTAYLKQDYAHQHRVFAAKDDGDAPLAQPLGGGGRAAGTQSTTTTLAKLFKLLTSLASMVIFTVWSRAVRDGHISREIQHVRRGTAKRC